MERTVLQFHGRMLVTLLQMRGALDGSSYRQLIERAMQARAAGARHMILDLSGVTGIGSAGLVALHQIAGLLCGASPPDTESGWEAFHALSDDAWTGAWARLNLLGPQPAVVRALERAGIARHLAVYADLDDALAAFTPIAAANDRSRRHMRYLQALNKLSTQTASLPRA
jgi:anti-anti-sigma regulatory factor